MKRVIVSVTNDLATDQRVQRVCDYLHKWGFHVILVGRLLRNSPDTHAPYDCKRMKLFFTKGFGFYAEYNIRLFFFLLVNRADIFIANDLDTLFANYLASRFKKSKLIFDSHEYFPETPEVYKRKRVKNFWLLVEKLCIKKCDGYYTVSQSIADIYKVKYNIAFNVIRNVPYKLPEKEINSDNYIIYQGSVNIGRGLELLLEAIKLDKRLTLLIAGEGPELGKLKNLAGTLRLENQVTFLGRMLPEKLKEYTLRASLGVSIEEPMGKSYLSALPNKLFDYIQARVPVLVSDFQEMKAIVDGYKVGMVLYGRTPENLVKILQTMIWSPELRKEWDKNLETAAQQLCWEFESEKLKSVLQPL